MKQKIIASITLATSLFTISAVRVNAAVTCGSLPQAWCDADSLDTVINFIANYIIGLLGIILAVVILYSAIEIISSAGSPDRIKAAKDRLMQAAVSIALLISFRVIIGLFGIT